MSSIEAIIFDLDDTLIDTAQIKQLRRRPWSECYRYIPTKTFALFGEELSSIIEDKNLKLGIVTNSPRPYATKVLLSKVSYFVGKLVNLICGKALYLNCDKLLSLV